jgi:hypothetical protein
MSSTAGKSERTLFGMFREEPCQPPLRQANHMATYRAVLQWAETGRDIRICGHQLCLRAGVVGGMFYNRNHCRVLRLSFCGDLGLVS